HFYTDSFSSQSLILDGALIITLADCNLISSSPNDHFLQISKLLWEHVLCSPLISLDVSEITRIFDAVISSSSVHVACLFEILIS
ncbi:4607_t:CDS:2, partial [Funneliformis mosseae]